MVWLRLLLLSCVACSAACARPTLDESDDAGALPSEGEEAGEPSGRDAATAPDARAMTPEEAGSTSPVGEDDAGPASTTPPADSGSCPDPDGDGVCSAVDNCPDVANPMQEDSDANGVGDACQPKVLADCKPDPLSSAVGDGIVSRVVINSAPGSVAQVKAGDPVDLAITLTFSSCSGVYAMQSFYLGLDGASPTCTFAGCSDQVTVGIPIIVRITAPAEAGLHYVLAGLTKSFCGPPGGSSVADTRIAALCVSPR